MVIAVVSWKGGVGKTTTAVCLAEAFAESGPAALLLDADPQGSAADWSEEASDGGRSLRAWCLRVPTPRLAQLARRELEAVTAPAGTVVVIDTPNSRQEIVTAALEMADLALIPTGATTMELPRVWPMLDAVRSAGVTPLVVLVRTRRQEPRASAVAREVLEGEQVHVAQTEIPYRAALAQARSGRPTPYQLAPFVELGCELMGVRRRIQAPA